MAQEKKTQHITTGRPSTPKEKRGVLLINIGSPNTPNVEEVKRYLKAFLNDPKVMDMPALLRKLLVNAIIVPFRAKKSARRYAQLWTKEGSPLTLHLRNLTQKLSAKLHDEMQVYSAVSYGQPSLKKALDKIQNDEISDLIILPLYPHYAQSTTESAIADIERLMQNKTHIKSRVVEHFYNKKGYIEAVAAQASAFELKDYDHVLFSYHSLPLKHVTKVKRHTRGEAYDYNAACHKTSKLIANHLGLSPNAYSTSFQSRFSNKWLGPYTNKVLEQLIQDKKKSVLVFTPSFVADCLETTVEIGIEYKMDFLNKGGDTLDLVPCPNAEDAWVEGIIELLRD